jgi:predicted ATPase
MSNQHSIKLKSVTLNGFKSFNSDDHIIEFGDVSVVIGANGAGKSNLVSFFKMIGYMMTTALQQYIGEQGGASALLNYGPKVTPTLSAKFVFSNESHNDGYYFSLVHAAQESLIFTHEILSFQDKKKYKEVKRVEIPVSGTKESGLKLDIPELKDFLPAKKIYSLLRNCSVYQFHDTSSTAKIRNSGYINQDDFLYSDGGNLAAFLYGLKENKKYRPYYDKIVRHTKQIFPQFGDFDLQPNARNGNYIILDWHEQDNTKYKLGAHQLSDGTIRFIALAALLLQPPENLPSVIVLDEPELGLHPSAIVELASMVKIASQHAQIVLASQSPALLDEFSPEQITVIERDPITKSSVFKKYAEEDLKDWLEEYTMSEIWDKNIIGGKP